MHELIPMFSWTELLDKTSSSSSSGYGCAVYAINDTHPAEQGKTYWKDFIK